MINFNNLIDNYLHRGASQKKIGRYYPSEVGSCMRKVWYSYKHPQEIKPELRRVFKMGNMVHDFVVDVLKSEKNPDIELLQSEMPLVINEKDFILSGRVDNILLLKSKNEKILVEVKSTKLLDIYSEPSSSHVMQLQLYMHATGIHKGLVVYLEKSTLQAKEFMVGYNPAEIDKIMARFSELHTHLIEDKLPQPEAKQDEKMSWMCSSCEYREICDLACGSNQ